MRACVRAHSRILAWKNCDLSVECFERVGVQACGRAGVRACGRGFSLVAMHVYMLLFKVIF